ncbi:MAG: protoheme IX farnesyltransferase [Bacteroidia bacterium]|nr:protoheme IX farnesyltransferase [Bacteroidia bacterium]MDW8015573.1 protoheme IX farnesyltransferase [Bacteroidia bacterium]
MAVLLSLSISFLHKLKLYLQLTKPRLSIVVVFSALIGGLVAGASEVMDILWLGLGGYMLTGSANAANQVWERHTDALMQRTKGRPLPAGLLSVKEATGFSLILLITSVFCLAQLGWDVVLLGLLAWSLYLFAYTPLKRWGPIAVVIGAIPGAIPPVIGYWAMQREITPILIALFVLQFAWQFPHFWVIAWLARTDYERAAFQMLPFPPHRIQENARAITLSIIALPVLSVLLLPLLPWKAWVWAFCLGTALAGVALYQVNLHSNRMMRSLLLSLTAYLTFLYLGIWMLL